MEEFTPEEKALLSHYFTSVESDIFALKNVPEVVCGALFSRYSRSDKSLRRLLLDEFINAPESGFAAIVSHAQSQGDDAAIATKKAEEFYDRVLVGYGDDSVAELGGAHIACENVSNIASKFLEDSRIGLSPLEKSTRYVFFNQKVNGQYRYYREPAIMQSEFAQEYVALMDRLFDTYSRLIEPMQKYFMERFPQGDASDRAYKSTIRAKACDVLRNFLPASTTTNVGIYGNGRAFEYLMLKMHSQPLGEMKAISQSMSNELGKVIPSFVKRWNDQYGQPTQVFLDTAREAMRTVEGRTFPREPIAGAKGVTLVDFDPLALDKIAATLLYQSSVQSMAEIRKRVSEMDEGQKISIINASLDHRQNRRHRPLRAFEQSYYTFDLLGNYGMYRDLQRHRVLTQERQELTTKHGFDTPKELVEAGFYKEYEECMLAAQDLYTRMFAKLPRQAQYVVPFGYRIRWYFTLNAREAFHLIELRTARQGHPDYRKMCQEMFHEIRRVHPWLAALMRYTDLNEYDLERLEAEKHLDKKLEKIAEKYGATAAEGSIPEAQRVAAATPSMEKDPLKEDLRAAYLEKKAALAAKQAPAETRPALLPSAQPEQAVELPAQPEQPVPPAQGAPQQEQAQSPAVKEKNQWVASAQVAVHALMAQGEIDFSRGIPLHQKLGMLIEPQREHVEALVKSMLPEEQAGKVLFRLQ